MSKPSTTSTPKIPTQLPQKSAWARGPPQTSTSPAVTSTSASPTRSQSPALPPSQNATNPPVQTHSRRSSALSQKGVTIKDGINIPSRGNVGSSKQNSVTFGSIDDNSATISSSPANVPPIKAEGVKSFGSVPAVNGGGKSLPSYGNQHAGPSSLKQSSSTSNLPTPTIISPTATRPVAPLISKSESSTSRPDAPAPSSTPTPKPTRVDIRKLFQNPPAPTSVTPQTNSDPSSPALSASSTTPSAPNTTAQSGHPPSQNLQNNVSTFNPRAGFQQTSSNGPPTQAPRSPAFPRQTNLANGTSGGVGVGNRPSPAPNTPSTSGIQPGMSSPRLSAPPHSAHPGPPPPGSFHPHSHYSYYYPYMPQDPAYMYPAPWMSQMPPPPHPGQGTPGPHPAPLPMSPRNPPNQLHPGTPSPVPPGPLPPPSPSHIHSHPNPNNVSSPPPTPSTTTAPPGPGGGGGSGTSRLNTGASTFFPKRVTIKSQDGREVDLGAWRRRDAPGSPVVENSTASIHQTHQKRTSVVRMETVEAKEKRLAEEKEREEKARKVEEEKKAVEEEKKRKEEEEKRRQEEEKKKAEEEEKRKEEAERKKKEEEEEAERERARKEEEEKERIRKEEEAKKAVEEEKRRREEEEKKKAAEAEKLRLAKEAEERRMQEEEKRVAAKLAEEQKPEEGEIIESPISEEPPKEVREIFSRKEALKIDTSITKARPGPLDLSNATKNVVPAPPSALATARIIEDLGHISYPEGVTSPKPELNVNSKKGKFRYDREFLLQFMAICTEKPDAPLDAIGLEAVGDQPHYPMTRGGSGRHRTSSAAMPPPLSRQASMPGFKPNAPGGFTMGNFSTPTNKMTSEERFAISQRSTSSTVTGSGMQFGRSNQMTRSSSQGGPGSNRTRSKRGGERSESNKVHAANVFNNQAKDQGVNFEPVAPLEVSANRWTRKTQADDEQNVERKVRSLLNKLTMEKFDPISDQIIEWANKSEAEKDGRTLIQVIRLVFEKATDEAAWSEMYARLCRKMMETISPNVQDDGIRNPEGKPITGGQLFRKYLLNRCQEDFERGWAAKDAAATAAAAKASEDAAVKKAAEASGEVELYSNEYYTAQKAKRQGLGLIQFIGELYKLQMLTERIMHECIKKLLGNVDNPEEEEIESLCRLLTTVGRLLDNPKARAHMDIYFTRMKELGKSNNVAPRMQFMLQDLIELRERKWIPRNQVAAPTTIAQVHEEAAKQRAQAEKEAANRTLTMSRGGSRRGGDRGGGPPGEQQVDGWSVAGGSTPRPPPKAGDLSNFGKINKSGPVVMGPSSVWAGKKDAAKRDSTLTRVNSSSNMFMMLGSGEAMPETSSKPSRPSSRRTSVDLGVGGVPEPQRRKLQLLPRSKPLEENKVNGGSPDHSEGEGGSDEAPQEMSEGEANKKIAEDIKEFFSIRNIDESEEYFSKLPSEHHHRLVDKMVSKAIESKEVDGKLVADAFARANEKNLCSISSLEEGFLPIAELLDDIAIDAPKAFQIMATMMKGAGLDKDEERRTRIAQKSMDSDKLLGLLA